LARFPQWVSDAPLDVGDSMRYLPLEIVLL
jgi:hypothetical protein